MRPGRWALASLSLAMLLPSLGTSIANAALPTLAQTFHASFQTVQWVVLSYLLASTTLIVSVGRLADLMGKRRLLLVGIGMFSLASGMCGVAHRLWLMIAARAAQGMGAALMLTLTLALVGEIVPKSQTGRAMGLLGTMSAIGTALGPSLGGVLIHGLGWRSIFFVNIPLGLVTLVLAHRHLPADRRMPKEGPPKLDYLGTLLLALTLGAFALAMTIGGRGSFGALNVGLLLGACGALISFVLAEGRAGSPLIRLSLFRDGALSASLAMSALVSTVMMATLVVGPFYLSRGLGLEPLAVGLVLSAGPLVAALSGVPAGRLADHFGAQRTTVAGLVGLLAGCFVMFMMPLTRGIPGYVAPIALITVGYALFQTANNAAVLADVAAEQRGLVSGLLNLSRNLGLISGASLMGAVFAVASATSEITSARPEAVVAGMQVTFLVAAGLVVAALAIVLARRFRDPRGLVSSDMA
ncbi:MAG TPA: MFS transporter [Polyangiaceae bacterium]|nr:MFS transporter [Polyangiaceae bacterium]